MKHVFFISMMCLLVLSGCKFSYSFVGTNIDYNETKTINIKEFTNQAALVYPTLTQIFSERMRDVYAKSTRLKFTDRDPDIEIEGEITRYDLSQQAVKDNAYASESRLTIGVTVRYKNNKNPAVNKSFSFSTYEVFSNSQTLTDVQDQLVSKMTTDLVDQIFNGTMSNW